MSWHFIKQCLKESYRLFFFELARRVRSFNNIPSHQRDVVFSITDNCNSQCIMCTQWKQKSYNELTTEEVNEILVQLKKVGIRNIGFTGGEPLLRKDLPEIIKKTNDLGFGIIHITTNGLLLTKERAISLIENGLRDVSISIDGTAEVHDHARGIKGSYDRSIKALKMLTELRDTEYSNLNISIATILMEPTLSEIVKVIDVARELHVTWGMNLIDTSPCFFNVDASELLIKSQDNLDEVIDELHKIKAMDHKLVNISHVALEYAKKYFKDPKREDIPCYLGYLRIYIGPHGDVYPSCWALPPAGNLRKNTLEEIINSKYYKKRLYEMFMKKCPGCACGYSLNLWYHLPSLYNEIKWHIKER